MIITKIERQKKRKQRYSIYIDGEFSLGIDEAVLIYFAIYKGQEISEELLAEIKDREYRQGVFAQGINYLSYGQRSIKEMREYLKKYLIKEQRKNSEDTEHENKAEPTQLSPEEGIDETLIDETIQRLIDQRLLNDTLYGQSYVRTAANLNRKGPQVLRRELATKGLSPEDIELALAEYPEEQQDENILALSEKYIRSNRKVPPRRLRQKLSEHLRTKGYPQDMVKEALDQIDFEESTVDQEQLLATEAEKILRIRRKRFQGYDLQMKIKESLYRKGFDMQEVQYWIEDNKHTWEEDK